MNNLFKIQSIKTVLILKISLEMLFLDRELDGRDFFIRGRFLNATHLAQNARVASIRGFKQAQVKIG